MWFWKRIIQQRACKKRLIESFPIDFKEDVEKVISILSLKKDFPISPDSYSVHLNTELLKIPYRVYFDEPDLAKEQTLSDRQRTILHCIFLRHCDGFLRQRRLEFLVDKTDSFIIPFSFQLLGEYVIEILFVLDRHINEANLISYRSFILSNPKYWQQTESRMISYWNEYYRRNAFRKLNDYIGKQIVNKLKKAVSTLHIEIKMSNISEVRMGSPFNLCEIQLIGGENVQLPRSDWQDKFAWNEDRSKLLLIRWNFTNNEPGFNLYLINFKKNSFRQSSRLLGMPKNISLDSDDKVAITKFYYDNKKTKSENFETDITEEYLF